MRDVSGRETRRTTLGERIDERVDALGRLLVALGRFFADIALFGGTILVLWVGLTWLGHQVDLMLGTAPRGSIIVGQAGPFAFLGLIAGCITSLYAIPWVVRRAHRRR